MSQSQPDWSLEYRNKSYVFHASWKKAGQTRILIPGRPGQLIWSETSITFVWVLVIGVFGTWNFLLLNSRYKVTTNIFYSNKPWPNVRKLIITIYFIIYWIFYYTKPIKINNIQKPLYQAVVIFTTKQHITFHIINKNWKH